LRQIVLILFRYSAQSGQSSPYLTKGNRYYIEFLVREFGGGYTVITRRFLEKYE